MRGGVPEIPCQRNRLWKTKKSFVIETEETFDVALDMEQFTSDATVGDLAGAVLAARFSQ